MADIIDNKQKLRRQLKSIRPIDCLKKSNIITNLMLGLPEFKKASALYLFINSFINEPDISEVMRTAQKLKKAIYIPSLNNDSIQFALLKSDDKLKPNRFGIGEASNPVFDDVVPDIIFVPCLGFDLSYNRLGRGMGCYDKYLKNSNALKICIAYSDYEVGTVYSNKLDVTMDIIITDKGVFRRLGV
ncbi:MAG: 5-formyltetrahydrofolate cyclo-ligase [Christensenellaceae bacterium]|jgi:5-formyltetrahydrofolate cyclo-ligase|nr:5-formyltetrahydrofolate cyclo-ligase [Christensenellaceae bacterium]